MVDCPSVHNLCSSLSVECAVLEPPADAPLMLHWPSGGLPPPWTLSWWLLADGTSFFWNPHTPKYSICSLIVFIFSTWFGGTRALSCNRSYPLPPAQRLCVSLFGFFFYVWKRNINLRSRSSHTLCPLLLPPASAPVHYMGCSRLPHRQMLIQPGLLELLCRRHGKVN